MAQAEACWEALLLRVALLLWEGRAEAQGLPLGASEGPGDADSALLLPALLLLL